MRGIGDDHRGNQRDHSGNHSKAVANGTQAFLICHVGSLLKSGTYFRIRYAAPPAMKMAGTAHRTTIGMAVLLWTASCSLSMAPVFRFASPQQQKDRTTVPTCSCSRSGHQRENQFHVLRNLARGRDVQHVDDGTVGG